jgi:DNA (cytosine-5)-methyltransferase 1
MLKVFEMFSGYGGASFGLRKANIPYECIGISEIDKYAVQCFNNNFPNIKNYGDCREINPNDLPDFDLLTGGFPCQAFSVAGKGLGELDTRGTLFYEIIRILEVKKPKYILLENVKGLTNKTHRKTFEKILSELKRIGYDVIWKVLNTKNYGIPQNRERVFFICKLGKWELTEFQFPQEEELKISVLDILDKKVYKKYLLSENALKLVFNRLNTSYRCKFNPNISNTLRTNYGGGYSNETYIFQQVFGENRIFTKLSPTITTKRELFLKEEGNIRRLTPKECFRLMGFLNDEINLDGLSDTQKYKLAGNGWDINLVSKLFREMFKQEALSQIKLQEGGNSSQP